MTRAAHLSGVIRSFTHGFGRRSEAVLRGLALELEPGSCVGLAGPNGAGKSTLLRLLAGLDVPNAGRVEVLGGDPCATHVRRQVGYLGEDSAFPPDLTGRAALSLIAALQGLPRAKRRVDCDRWLERVGLTPAAEKRLGTYSRGMLRRFGLAQAFLDQPRLVLLDEPTAGLDAPGYPVLQALLNEAREGGGCVLLSSHLLSDLADTCDRVHVLFDGVIARSGSARDIAPDGLGALYGQLTDECRG